MTTSKQIRREARHLFRLCLVNGSLDELRVRRAVQNVLQFKRRRSPSLLSHFLRFVRLDRSRHTAEVESAAPLPDDLQASVAARIERVYGPKIRISFAQKPALIGGMRVKVGSDVYDGSVKARLAALEKCF